EKLAKVSEDARADVEASRERSNDNERLREEVAELSAALAEREKALTEARLPLGDAREHWERQTQASVAAAEAAWQAEEATRLAAAEAQWRRQADNTAAELTLRCERAEKDAKEFRAQVEAVTARDQNNRFELRRLREDLSIAEANLASRDA